MQSLSSLRPRRLIAATLALGGASYFAAVGVTAAPVAAVPDAGVPRPDDIPVRGLIHRALTPAPAGADAIRLSVLGDGSGAQFQVRLLSGKEDGVVGGYLAAPAIPIDFRGWKTLILPLSQFTFHADSDPAANRDGIGDAAALATGATAVQLALTTTSARIYIDEIGWTTAAATATDAPLAVIDDFANAATVPAIWKADGDFEQIRTVGIAGNRLAAYARDGKGSLSFTVRATGQDQSQLEGPALDARLRRTPAQPYVVYARAPFDTITPDCTPRLREILPAPSVSIFMAAGQAEPATFAVYAGLPIKGATAALSGPLVSKSKGRIPAASVTIDVVRDALTLDGPQLLMKDDRQPLTGPLPRVRLTGNPVTDIAAHTSKQFWITIRTTADQAPGLYIGKIVFQAPGMKPTGVTLNVEVLPVVLRTPHYQYGIDLLSMLSPTDAAGGAPGEQTVTPEMLKAQLTDIRSHGFKMVILHDRPANLSGALQAYKDAGMSAVGPVVVAAPMQSGDFATVAGLKQSLGLSADFDIYYRLPADRAQSADAAREYGQQARSADKGALIVSTVPSEGDYSTLSAALGDQLAPMYTLSSDHAATLMTTGHRATPNRDWWTWSIGANDPMRNRLYAGFLLFKTGNGLYGAFVGPYQFAPTGTDPYSLFAAEPPATATAAPLQMAAFPVEGGVLDTVQWEAVRSGIDDIRYIDALKTISRELKDARIGKSATDLADSLLIGLAQRPMITLTPTQLQAMRRQIAGQTVKLSQMLKHGG